MSYLLICKRSSLPIDSAIMKLLHIHISTVVVIALLCSTTLGESPATSHLIGTVERAGISRIGDSVWIHTDRGDFGAWSLQSGLKRHADFGLLANSCYYIKHLAPDNYIAVVGRFNGGSGPASIALRILEAKSLRMVTTCVLPNDLAAVSFVTKNSVGIVRRLDVEPSEASDKPVLIAEYWKQSPNGWSLGLSFDKCVDNRNVTAMSRLGDRQVIIGSRNLTAIESGDVEVATEVHLCDFATMRSSMRAKCISNPTWDSFAVSRDEKYVVCGDMNRIEVLTLPSLDRVLDFKPENRFYCPPVVAISEDGRYIAFGSESLSVMDVKAKKIVFAEKYNSDIVRSEQSLCKLINPQANDNTEAEFWVRRQLCICDAAFTANGKQLVVVSRHGEIRVWDVEGWSLVKKDMISVCESSEMIIKGFVRAPASDK